MDLLHQQVMDMHMAGHPVRGIASELNISHSKAQRIIQKHKPAPIYDDTDDVPCNETFDTPDTAVEPSLDTLNDTGDTGRKTATDTQLDTFGHIINEQKNIKKEPLSSLRSYTLAETRLLMIQTALLKEDIQDYVSEVVDLHSGGTSIMVSTYSFYLRRAKRLIQSTKLLSVQLQEEHKNLPALKLLQELKDTIQDTLSNSDKYLEVGQVWLNIDEYDTAVWQDYLDADLFNPVI